MSNYITLQKKMSQNRYGDFEAIWVSSVLVYDVLFKGTFLVLNYIK